MAITFYPEGTTALPSDDETRMAIKITDLLLNGGIAVAAKYLVTANTYAPVAGDVVAITAQLATSAGVAVHTAGLTVTWSKTGSGGSFANPTSVTNASGIATINFITGGTAGTVYVVTGTDNNGLTGSTSNITSVVGAAAKYIVTGDDMTPDADQVVAISAQLADANNNSVSTSGLTVTWSKTGGAGGTFSNPTSVTNGSGIAVINFTAQVGTYVVTATDTNAITGSSANIVTALSALNSDWNTRILAAGGVRPSDNTFLANDVWYAALVSASLPAKIGFVNTFAPDSLIAAITPLIKGNGFDSWTNTGPFVGGDLTVNGLIGDGAAKHLKTGCVATGLGVSGGYIFTDIKTAPNQNEIGAASGIATESHRLYLHLSGNDTVISNNGNFLSTTITTGNLEGYLCGSRTSLTRFDLYYANSGVAHSSVFNDTASNPGTNPAVTFYVFASNENAVASNFSRKRLSMIWTGAGWSTADSLAFYNATQQLRTSYGGGFL